jgi:hypothetical protein
MIRVSDTLGLKDVLVRMPVGGAVGEDAARQSLSPVLVGGWVDKCTNNPRSCDREAPFPPAG